VVVGPGLRVGLDDDGARPQLLGTPRPVVIAAARVMPGVCGVFASSSPARTTRTPSRRQSFASGEPAIEHRSIAGLYLARRTKL
jgi:hypothetical protein